MKFCVNCKNLQYISERTDSGHVVAVGVCMYTVYGEYEVLDVVSGMRIKVAIPAEKFRSNESYCGSKANWYKER